MKLKPIPVAAAIFVIGLAGWLILIPRHSLQPTIFIFSIPESAESDLKRLAFENCPKPALAGEELAADYEIIAMWRKEQWTVSVERKNRATIFQRSDTNYKRLIQEACKAVYEDFPIWLDTERRRGESLRRADQRPEEESNRALRYELHDMRNGPLTSTALLDRQTGRVWVWTETTDKKGRKVGDYLSQVEVSPPPEKE